MARRIADRPPSAEFALLETQDEKDPTSETGLAIRAFTDSMSPIARLRVSRVFLQVGRVSALAVALSGVGWIAATEVLAAEDEPIALSLEVPDDPRLEPRFASVTLIPDAKAAAPPPIAEPVAESTSKRKKAHRKLKFGRMDAY